MTSPLNISARKVGGIRFLKLGRINISFSVSRRPSHTEVAPLPAPLYSVRPVIKGTAEGGTLAGLRLYRNGKFQTVRWSEAFADPGLAFTFAQAAARRSGIAIAR